MTPGDGDRVAGVRLVVGDDVRERFPAYRAVVVKAWGVKNGPSDEEWSRARRPRAPIHIRG